MELYEVQGISQSRRPSDTGDGRRRRRWIAWSPSEILKS
jgi:hypothetical protein